MPAKPRELRNGVERDGSGGLWNNPFKVADMARRQSQDRDAKPLQVFQRYVQAKPKLVQVRLAASTCSVMGCTAVLTTASGLLTEPAVISSY